MSIKKIHRMLAIAIGGTLILSSSLFAQQGYFDSGSAFHNIGYTIADPTTPAPVVDYDQAQTTTPYATAPVASVYDAGGDAGCTAAGCDACCDSGCDSCCSSGCGCGVSCAQRAASAFQPVFYDNDFTYLCDRRCCGITNCGDCLKRRGHDGFVFDIGGQYRSRSHREEGHRGFGITGRNDNFTLSRFRLYANAEIGSNLRVFAEGIHAYSSNENFAPRLIEENKMDVQNLFIDVKLWEDCGRSITARGGRQEILLGRERYVSPLDWANTRRTFDGGRILFKGPTWDIDGFWLAPTIRDFDDFDESNEDVAFYGVYGSRKAANNGTLDLYWLAFDDDINSFYFDSLGARYNGKVCGWLFETEGAYQFGENADGSDHSAGFFVTGIGKSLSDRCFKPTGWLYFDWASGDDDLGAGNGHHHFQPLAHKYNGFMDLYGRRNLMDLNFLTTWQLTKKLKGLIWYHNFWLENDNDTPYSVNMAAQQAGVTPADDHLGNELDLMLTYTASARSNIVFGYSRFWAGDYYDTPGILDADGAALTRTGASANFYYLQYTMNF